MTGHTLWIGDSGSNSCVQCHVYAPAYTPGPPQFPQLNAANSSAVSSPTLDYVIPKMFCTYATNRTAADRQAIQQYFATLVPADIDTTMAMGNGATFLD